MAIWAFEMSDYKLLEWDSKFFGFRVGMIVPEKLNKVRLNRALDDLQRQKVRLVYWASDSNCPDSMFAGLSLGGQLVDKKVVFLLDHRTLQDRSCLRAKQITEFEGRTATQELETLAIQSGELSRFNRDRRISRDRFEELYRTWVRRSVAKEIADAVQVIRSKSDKVAGMVTVGRQGDRGDIGLVAVDPSCRGKGYGRMLVNAAVDHFCERSLRFSQVVTQSENKPACRLYEAVGYRLESCQNFFHFWLH